MARATKKNSRAAEDGDSRQTPMVRQYNAIKSRYPNYILLYRMGDFYEMFGEDAREAAPILGVTLTSRPWGGNGEDMPLAGVPFHAVDGYLAKLIRAGRKVAICDQTEDPKQAKGIVQREVTRIVTPGTILESEILDAKSHNFLAATCERPADGQGGAPSWGLAITDLSTGAFEVTEFRGAGAVRHIFSEIGRLSPAEVLVPESLRRREGEWLDPSLKPTITWTPDGDFERGPARRRLLEQFEVQSLEGFDAEHLDAALGAAGALVQYLRDTQLSQLKNIRRFNVYSPSDYLVLDLTTQRSLELVRPLHDAERGATLLGVLDHTRTGMGGRMLRGWLLQPLKNVNAIRARLDAVETIVESPTLRNALAERLKQIQDLERIISRIGLGTGSPRDLTGLRLSLRNAPPLVGALAEADLEADSLLARLRDAIDPHDALRDLLDRALSDNPPPAVRDGGVIRAGFNEELDGLREIAENTSDWIESMRREEAERTGIQNLKIGYNKVFGFYIEISKANLSNVPPEYIRKQTLVNAERYITPELKEKEEVILNAQERIAALEDRLFREVREQAAAATASIQELAGTIARIDCLASLAAAAIAGRYVKPDVDDGDIIDYRDGRHPVIEALQTDRPFVPNDLTLSNGHDQVLLITGPNMAGKSTFIRQTALIVLMAHMGCFVPAREARIGMVDRIFTRVGAMDHLVRGQSTFLVEMNETANILNNATDRSLVILDEIGRGTSTYDGLSIAWAVTEYLHSTEGRRPKTLFATHYHELTELAEQLDRVRNFNAAVLEQGEEITFLFKITAGATGHSYGIHAGKLAGLPPSVIDRAQAILHQLEFGAEGARPAGRATVGVLPPDHHLKVEADDGMVQLTLFDGIDHPVLTELRELDANRLTPMQALEMLHRLAEKAR